MSTRRFALLTFAVLASPIVASCGSPEGAATSSSTVAPSASALKSGGAASAAEDSAYAEETSTRPVELLKFQWTSGVKSMNPVDKLDHAEPGQRVYAHLTIRNRTGRPRTVHATFSVNGKVRTENVTLDVKESWSFRTWAYVTLQKKDEGKVTVVISDDEGFPLVDETLPIRGG
ncbi:MAG: hypothetical protein U0271_18955 [Polyangiaceae bacterium]